MEQLNNCIKIYKKNKLSSSLNDYKWQLSVIDKETSTLCNNKYEKLEISFKFDINENMMKDKDCLIKLNYYEFNEIHEHLKKVENQLKGFK